MQANPEVYMTLADMSQSPRPLPDWLPAIWHGASQMIIQNRSNAVTEMLAEVSCTKRLPWAWRWSPIHIHRLASGYPVKAQPPSTTKLTPVMYLASGLAKNMAGRAISSELAI
jgi:hypothetical protein